MRDATPWFLAPEVLDILALIRGTELRVTSCRDDAGRIREEWQRFDDCFVSSLEAWRAALAPASPVLACDIAAAVTGMRLVGTHYLSDEDGLLALRDRVAAALSARSARRAA